MSIGGRRLIPARGGTRTEQQLGTDDLLAAYRDHFRIMLSRVPDTRQRSRTVGPRSLIGPRRTLISPEMIARAGLGRLPELRLRGGGDPGCHGQRAGGRQAPGRADRGLGAAASGALAALAAGLGLAGTVALLTVAGAGRALLDVASRSLLQRSVSAQSLGQVFGLLEGLTRAGLAIGSMLVPLLVHLGGSRFALLGVAAVLPVAAAAGGRALFTLDAQAPVPVVQIALLRSLALFAELPAPAVEGFAAALTPAGVPAGAVLIRQGEQGDAYYAIAAGQLDVLRDGRFLRRCGRHEGVGEIALLRAVPRTANDPGAAGAADPG